MVGLVDLAGDRIIEGAGENAGGGGLADAAHAGQHIGLGNAAGAEGIGQRADHRLLADQIGEALRPVFARQHPIRTLRHAVMFAAVHTAKFVPDP